MQFTVHYLPVHQFVTALWDFDLVPYCQPSSPTQSLPITGQQNMQLPLSLEWHVWLGRRSIYNTMTKHIHTYTPTKWPISHTYTHTHTHIHLQNDLTHTHTHIHTHTMIHRGLLINSYGISTIHTQRQKQIHTFAHTKTPTHTLKVKLQNSKTLNRTNL